MYSVLLVTLEDPLQIYPPRKPSLSTYAIYISYLWPQIRCEINNCNTQWLKTIQYSQVCGLTGQFWSLVGSLMSLWSAVGWGGALLIIASLRFMSGGQLAEGWPVGTAGLSSSHLLHPRASPAPPPGQSRQVLRLAGHILMAISKKQERQWRHASFLLFPRLPSSSYVLASHWPKQVPCKA